MPFEDLLEYHEVEGYVFDLRAESEMEQWRQLDPKYRGSAPYRRL